MYTRLKLPRNDVALNYFLFSSYLILFCFLKILNFNLVFAYGLNRIKYIHLS